MPRENGMLMSTSGRQKKPRSARMTRKSCASASMAPPAKQWPCTAATVAPAAPAPGRAARARRSRSRGSARRSATASRGRGRWRRTCRCPVVTSARWPSVVSTVVSMILDGGEPVGVEAVLGVAEVEDEDLAVAVQGGHCAIVGDAKMDRCRDNDLLPLLRKRLVGLYSPLLADTTATHPVHRRRAGQLDGRHRARAGRRPGVGSPSAPTTTVRAALAVLDDVVSGRAQRRRGVPRRRPDGPRQPGAGAAARRPVPRRPADDTRTYTRSVRADGIETFYLESGPLGRAAGRARPRPVARRTRRCCR